MIMRRSKEGDNRRLKPQQESTTTSMASAQCQKIVFAPSGVQKISSVEKENNKNSRNNAIDPRIGLFDLSKELSMLNIWIEKCPYSIHDVRKFYQKVHIPAMHSFPPKLYQMLRTINGNDVCVDCMLNSDNASHDKPVSWANTRFGTLICNECAFDYFSTGHETSVLSLELSYWTLPDVLLMFEGGNGRLIEELFEKKKRNFLARSKTNLANTFRRSSNDSSENTSSGRDKTKVLSKDDIFSFRKLKPLLGSNGHGTDKLSERYETKPAKDYELSLVKRVAEVCSLYSKCDVTYDCILEQRENRGNIGTFKNQLPTAVEVYPTVPVDEEDNSKRSRRYQKRRSLSSSDLLADMQKVDHEERQNLSRSLLETKLSQKYLGNDTPDAPTTRRGSLFSYYLADDDVDLQKLLKHKPDANDKSGNERSKKSEEERKRSSQKDRLRSSGSRRKDLTRHHSNSSSRKLKDPEGTRAHVSASLERSNSRKNHRDPTLKSSLKNGEILRSNDDEITTAVSLRSSSKNGKILRKSSSKRTVSRDDESVLAVLHRPPSIRLSRSHDKESKDEIVEAIEKNSNRTDKNSLKPPVNENLTLVCARDKTLAKLTERGIDPPEEGDKIENTLILSGNNIDSVVIVQERGIDP